MGYYTHILPPWFLPRSGNDGGRWDWKQAPSWEPKKPADAAKCLCALYYRGDNTTERHNFGAHAYNGYRVTDGGGANDDSSVHSGGDDCPRYHLSESSTDPYGSPGRSRHGPRMPLGAPVDSLAGPQAPPPRRPGYDCQGQGPCGY